MSSPFVLWLNEVGRESTPLVGGKSANLGELQRMGMPVPGGFAITAVAYERFLSETGAAQEIEKALNCFTEENRDIALYEEVCEDVSLIMEQKQLPLEIQEAVIGHYETLCDRYGDNVPVAVRSSGLAEDLEDASFAGQYESYLNVRGKKDLLEKIVACWSSQFTVRAMTYRHKKGLPIEGDAMGITVLKMVAARSSGVGFTAHPLNGDESKIVLEGSWGLGESIVQGLVTPDRYVFDKETLTLVKKTISEKDKLMKYAEQGIQEDNVPLEQRQAPCLSDEEAYKIAELAKILETNYKQPQDIEWAVDEEIAFPENIFLVQARPITVSHEKSEKEKAEYLADLMIHMFRQYRSAAKSALSPEADQGPD